MIQNYLKVLSKYATFSGRARRQEYWLFVLVHVIVGFIVGIIQSFVPDLAGPLLVLWIVYALATLIPNIALTFRRLHDTGRSAWWILIALVPFVGAIVLLVFYCLPGTVGPNKYGEDPKQDDGVVPTPVAAAPVAPAPVEPPPAV